MKWHLLVDEIGTIHPITIFLHKQSYILCIRCSVSTSDDNAMFSDFTRHGIFGTRNIIPEDLTVIVTDLLNGNVSKITFRYINSYFVASLNDVVYLPLKILFRWWQIKFFLYQSTDLFLCERIAFDCRRGVNPLGEVNQMKFFS